MRDYKGRRNSEKELVIVALNASREGGLDLGLQGSWDLASGVEVRGEEGTGSASYGKSAYSKMTELQCNRFCDSQIDSHLKNRWWD